MNDRSRASSRRHERPAIVLWLGPTGLTLVRSLGRRGIEVVALHDDAAEPATGTRYAKVRILPSLANDEQAWIDALVNEGRRIAPKRGVLFAASDATWLLVARHRAILAPYFDFPLPSDEHVCDWPGKTFQHAAAKRAGVLVPMNLSIKSVSDLELAAAGVKCPCLLKPTYSHLWQRVYSGKLTFAQTPERLLAHGTDALSRGLEFSVQEYIPAEDHDVYCVHCYLDRASQPLAACVVRKTRQCEPRFGTSTLSVSVHEPRARGLALRLLKSMGFHGIASVEFKRDLRDGQFKLMEVNVRAPLMLAATINSGVDVPYIAYRDLIGDPLPPVLDAVRLGRGAGDLARDLHAARFYRELGWLNRRDWLRSWRRVRELHFAWDDLGPFRGLLHMLRDHWKRGKFRAVPSNFPTAEEWAAGSCPPS